MISSPPSWSRSLSSAPRRARGEVDPDLARDVRALHPGIGAATTTAPTAEEISKQVSDAPRALRHTARAEQVFHAPAAAATAAARRRAVGSSGVAVEAFAQAFLAKLVVEAALCLVRQGLIGAIHGLESSLGLLVARVLVGVQLGGELAICFFDLGVGRTALDSELFVKVSGHGSTTS